MKHVHNRILRIMGNVIMLKAPGVSFGELAMLKTDQGISLAEVIRIEGEEVFLQVFAGSSGIGTEDEVEFLGHAMQVPFSNNLLGRIFDGKGVPRDRGPDLTDQLVATGGPCLNPVTRNLPSRMIHTKIPMIDLFNSLVEAQKISIFTQPGEPYNELMARVALQADVDLIVFGGMGLRYDDYLFFKEEFEQSGAISRSILFVHTAQDPVVEALKVPDLALAVAENFALQGKRVLCLLSDMTNFADALKEVSIIMEQIPANRGYPGDLYSQLAKRYEKAADIDGAGSVTVLSVTTMPGNDVTHPVPDNTGYITEGQYYLNNGRIEPFGSLSRLKQLVNGKTRADHRAIMDGMIQLYAKYQETLEKKSMGFRMSDWDERVLNFGVDFESQLMNLEVNIPLHQALDQSWRILAQNFTPEETGLKSELVAKFWPQEGEA